MNHPASFDPSCSPTCAPFRSRDRVGAVSSEWLPLGRPEASPRWSRPLSSRSTAPSKTRRLIRVEKQAHLTSVRASYIEEIGKTLEWNSFQFLGLHLVKTAAVDPAFVYEGVCFDASQLIEYGGV